MGLLELAAVFAVGAMVGSFLNVCIWRVPEGKSIAFPGSHCRACAAPIAWYDNVPVVSWLLLSGKCRRCKAAISPQYPAVELLTAATFVLFWTKFGPTPEGAVYLLFTLAILVQAGIDFRHRIIPDVITLPGMLIGLGASALVPAIQGQESALGGFVQSLVGLLAGGGLLYVTGTIAEWIFKKEAMGGGDVKLLAMIGAFLGWPAVLWTIFVSSLLGSVVGLWMRFRHGAETIPYGPYLGAAAVSYIFWGRAFMQWYFQSLRG